MEHYLFLHALATLTLLFFLCDPTTGAAAVDVLDVDGGSLVRDEKYYIVPNTTYNGGGLTWSIKKETAFCPYFFVSELEENSNLGSYVTFSPSKSNLHNISVSSDLNIEFPDVSLPRPWYCFPTSSVWQVKTDPASELLLVALGGTSGNAEDVSSWFKIEKHEVNGYYKIKYCPSNSSSNNDDNGVLLGDIVCSYLGVIFTDGGGWLGLNDKNPLAVVFKKNTT